MIHSLSWGGTHTGVTWCTLAHLQLLFSICAHPPTHMHTRTHARTHAHKPPHTHTHTGMSWLSSRTETPQKKAIFNTRSQDWHIPASVPWPILLSGRHIWCVLPSLKPARVSHTLWIGPLSSPLSVRLWQRTMTTRCIPHGRTLFHTGSIKKHVILRLR